MENAPKETDEQIIERTERSLAMGVWRSADGRRKKFSEMDDDHLANTIFMLHRGTDANGRKVNERLKEKLPFLEAEWRFRHGEKPVTSERPFNPKTRR